jgi:hypothetical protein
MSEIIKDENVDLRLKIHAAAVNMQAYKHTLEMMDLTFGVNNAIKSLNRYRESSFLSYCSYWFWENINRLTFCKYVTS